MIATGGRSVAPSVTLVWMEVPSTLVPPPAARSLAQHLRTATRPVHQALEARLDLAGTSWSRDRYAAFLRATLAVVGPLEAPIAAAIGERFVRWDTSRADRLRRDLARLGAPSVVDAGSGPAMTTAEAFGAAYVVEGSQLGARFIAAELARRLDLHDDALAYLRPREVMGPTWSEFVAALDAFGTEDPRSASRVEDAAARTFRAFERAFEREGFV